MASRPRPSSTHQELEFLCRRFRVQVLYVFGSRAAEAQAAVASGGRSKLDPRNASDLDVAVSVPTGVMNTARLKTEFAIALEDLFGADRVDLVVLGDADPFLAVNIIRGVRLFCEDPTAADELELLVLRRAGDLEPFERRRIESLLSLP
jgi:predicted nucleotidyltransferase